MNLAVCACFWQILCILEEIYQKKHVSFRIEYVITGRNKYLILLCNGLRKSLVKYGNFDYLRYFLQNIVVSEQNWRVSSTKLQLSFKINAHFDTVNTFLDLGLEMRYIFLRAWQLLSFVNFLLVLLLWWHRLIPEG